MRFIRIVSLQSRAYFRGKATSCNRGKKRAVCATQSRSLSTRVVHAWKCVFFSLAIPRILVWESSKTSKVEARIRLTPNPSPSRIAFSRDEDPPISSASASTMTLQRCCEFFFRPSKFQETLKHAKYTGISQYSWYYWQKPPLFKSHNNFTRACRLFVFFSPILHRKLFLCICTIKKMESVQNRSLFHYLNATLSQIFVYFEK